MSDEQDESAQVRELRRQLRFALENNHRRNLELDALHYVWCDGGCYNGVHRFHDRPLDEETVLLAERNTARLRKWWNGARFRDRGGQGHGKARKAAGSVREQTQNTPTGDSDQEQETT